MEICLKKSPLKTFIFRMVSEGQRRRNSLLKLFWLRVSLEIAVKLFVGLLTHSSVLKLWALATVNLADGPPKTE